MKRIMIAIVALVSLAGFAKENLIWDDRPAGQWEKSWYPLGNGSLGCMVDGGVTNLQVQFNVDTLWTGDKNITGPVNDANANENYKSLGSYQNFGTLKLVCGDFNGKVSNYRRELNVADALYSDSFTAGGVKVKRTLFASAPDNAIVAVIETSNPVNISLNLKSAHDDRVISPYASVCKFSGKLGNGLKYAARADLFEGKSENERIVILRAATGDDSGRKAFAGFPLAPIDAKAMIARHVADYKSYYDRMEFDLGDGDKTVPTRVRFEKVRAGGSDVPLTALQFNFGRYLLISCSRPGTSPANLQGLWNDRNNPAWHGDYHTNINIQMNYWGADVANLSDCFLPFSDWMMKSLPVVTEVTRITFPDSKGFAYQTSANIFGGGGWRWNFAGAPWMAAQCYDHYLFTRDEKYLRDIAWPLMKGAAEFMISEELKERADGTVIVKDGWSPEHGPREDGVAHDQQITRELFKDILAAAKTLGIDDDFTRQVAKLQSKLLKDKIGSWGQLQEWETDRDVKGDQHRHTSHLFAVYPGSTITRETPELYEAAKVALDGRTLTGDARRSWTWPWRAALWARLGEPDKAGAMLAMLLRYNTRDNLFATHPPFQIDGNLGMIGAVGEILLNSDNGKKLPKTWVHGSVKGLRTRSGTEIGFSW